MTPQSLRMSGDHKLKEGDEIAQAVESTNNVSLLFFTDRRQVYKAHAFDFDDTKVSLLGDYIPAKMGMDEGERVVKMVVTQDYSGFLLFFFENGKAAKVELNRYETKQNRRKLVGAYSDKSVLVDILHGLEDGEVLMKSTSSRMLLLHTGALTPKATRDTQGVQVMTQRKAHRLESVRPFEEGMVHNANRYRVKSLPAIGALPAAEDLGEQLTL